MTRGSIIDALKTVFGADKIKGDLLVDPNIALPSWLANLKPALELFKIPGLHVLFEGSSLDIGGSITAPERDKILAGLKAIFGSSLTIGATASVTETTQIATVLSGLKPGFSGTDLTAILNQYAINFATGSAEIPEVSKPLLLQGASLIKQLPATTLLHIDGYTDSTGDPAANVVLSQQRADAVRELLINAGVPAAMLIAKGYGSANSTQGSNRFDRRIEFTVQ
jgi:outer membrane protein OmpA-like peptidoglycan-associated protein